MHFRLSRRFRWRRTADYSPVSWSRRLARIGKIRLDKRPPSIVTHSDARRPREGHQRGGPDRQQDIADVIVGGSEVEVRVAGHVDFTYELVYPDGRTVPVWRTGVRHVRDTGPV